MRPGSRCPGRRGPGGNATARTLDLGREVPGGSGARYGRITGSRLVFTVHARAVEILDAELHDHGLLAFPVAKVTQVELRWPGRAVGLTRDPNGTPKVPAWLPAAGADLAGVRGGAGEYAAGVAGEPPGGAVHAI